MTFPPYPSHLAPEERRAVLLQAARDEVDKVQIFPPDRPAPEGYIVFPIIENTAQWDVIMTRRDAIGRSEAARDITPQTEL